MNEGDVPILVLVVLLGRGLDGSECFSTVCAYGRTKINSCSMLLPFSLLPSPFSLLPGWGFSMYVSLSSSASFPSTTSPSNIQKSLLPAERQ